MNEYSEEHIAGLRAGQDGILKDIKTLHVRLCHGCNKPHWHADAKMPYVLCPECGSQDTRKCS